MDSDELRFSPTYRPPADCSHLEIEQFRYFVSQATGKHLTNYDALHTFSVEEQNSFWLLLWKYLDIIASTHPTSAVSSDARIDQLPVFYPEARLNYAENALRLRSSGAAIISFAEHTGFNSTTMSWRELHGRVAATASAMGETGLRVNDVVAYLGANTPSAVIAFLATASRGAIFCSLAGDMGEQAVIDRLKQVKPKILFADNGYQYNGKMHDQHCIWVENVKNASFSRFPEDSHWMSLPSFLSRGKGDNADLNYVQVPFSHPMTILFSSDTTGIPKGMVHSHGGPLINLKKEHVLHENMSSADVYYHYSNIGWTMWNIFLGGMLAGATLVLYDGSPFYPTATRHFDHILSLGTTVFGASPRYYTELRNRDFWLRSCSSKSNIRLLESTGAVLPASIWSWLAAEFNQVPIISFSGGTEVCGSFVHGTIAHSQVAGEITVKALGVDVDIFDAKGASCTPGEPGDLVIKRPFPNAAVRFWGDVDGKRYQAAYFERFPGVWTQGDFARINPKTKGIIIDGILNPSGVRFGSAEIYKVLEPITEVEDSLCVGQRLRNLDEQVLLFLQLKTGIQLSAALLQRIRVDISRNLSPRHVPKHIVQVAKIPYNANGKKLEVVVKGIVSGNAITDKVRSTLTDPYELDPFLEFVALSDIVDGKRAKL